MLTCCNYHHKLIKFMVYSVHCILKVDCEYLIRMVKPTSVICDQHWVKCFELTNLASQGYQIENFETRCTLKQSDCYRKLQLT